MNPNGTCTEFLVMRTDPSYEKYAINAAIVNRIADDYRDLFETGGYILDGSRSINHETAFQDYLEKYFGFRKAYCKLKIVYRRGVKAIVSLLYPYRKLLASCDSYSIIHKINGSLRMEDISRNGDYAVERRKFIEIEMGDRTYYERFGIYHNAIL